MRISDWSSDVCPSDLHDVGVSVAITGRILPRGEKVKGLICKGGNGDIEQRHVEMSALAGISPPDKSCQDRDRRVETRHDVRQGNARLHRATFLRTRDAH